MTITAIYAALLGLLFLALSVNVVRTRRTTRVSLGAGDDPLLERRIRAHGNFAEYTPIGLVLIAIVETTGGAPAIVHGLGLALLVARLMHGIALSSLTLRPVFRTGGMVLTFAVVAVAAISLLLERAIAAAT